MIKKLILFLTLFAFASCDVHFHDGEESGYFAVWGDRYWLETAVEYYPPVDQARDSDLVRVVFGDEWRNDDEPGLELFLWTPFDTGLVPGRYVWDPVTPEPYGIAEGWVWGYDYDWESRIVGGTIEVDRWGQSCSVEFDLVIEGGRRLTGNYRGELRQGRL